MIIGIIAPWGTTPAQSSHQYVPPLLQSRGLYDCRLGRVSARRAPVDEVARVLALFDTRYWDFTAKHFHEKLVSEHGCERSYNWVRLTLQARGRMRPARRAPAQAAAARAARHDGAPGRLAP